MWNIRSGMQTLFWTDRWLQDGPPLAEFAPNLLVAARNLRVAEVVLNGDWNMDFFRAHLPEALALQVQLHLVPAEIEADVPMWRFSESGRFTLHTAHELRREEEAREQHLVWKTVWKIEGPQRTKQFFGLVLHKKLLTNSERCRRHLASSDRCQVCGGGPESVIHVLRDCSYARSVWSSLLVDEPDTDFFEADVTRWVLHYLSGRSKAIEPSLFAILCWQLWNNKNQWVFEEKLAGEEQLVRVAKQMWHQSA
ncbi:unnamed protein product [Linum trigynum]|uniref:Reverse transcriptase zinc-binding domain-containing protein n=1 Tax=Linum trigynum TaxID=586398 RepID=A0AAV2DQQ6_9ROSI